MIPHFHLIGLPTDINSSFERGAAAGPAAIRAALWSERGNLSCENGMEIGVDFRIVDQGDLCLAEAVAHDDRLIQEAVAQSLASDSVPILLGGDHSITFPIMRAIHHRYGPVTILHFDAHPDLYDDFEGNPRSHASPFARIMEAGLATRLVQIGLRTLTRHCRDQAARFNVEIIEMRHFADTKVPQIEGPTYISCDLDALDPSIAPGVAHPEPGGLTIRDMFRALDQVRGQIIGADIVELNPVRDIGGVTAIVAAKLVREIASRAAFYARGA